MINGVQPIKLPVLWSDPMMSRKFAPNIGMSTIRNENLATSSFLTPRINPVAIVAPEREMPPHRAGNRSPRQNQDRRGIPPCLHGPYHRPGHHRGPRQLPFPDTTDNRTNILIETTWQVNQRKSRVYRSSWGRTLQRIWTGTDKARRCGWPSRMQRALWRSHGSDEFHATQ